MSRTKCPLSSDATDHGPRIGALLRLAWQSIRERIYSGVRSDGYGDLNPAHVALFRYEGLDGQRPTQLAESIQITKQSVNEPDAPILRASREIAPALSALDLAGTS